MELTIDARKASTEYIEKVLYISFNGLWTAVTYIYISFTGLLEALCGGYNLICNVTLQLNTQQEDENNTSFEKDAVNINNLATNVCSKRVINGNDPCGSYPLNSLVNLSKDLKGLMRRGPSLRLTNESGVGKSPYSLSLLMYITNPFLPA